MSRIRTRRPLGAERRTEESPFGDREARRGWQERIAAFDKLDDALAALIEWRERHVMSSLRDQNALWIEARLEERVAVLRFQEKSNDAIRTTTLTGEPIASVQLRFRQAAETADAIELEKLAAEFRLRYKPPVMPSSPFLRVETALSELLMKRRSLNWFEPSIEELRARRGATVIKEGWTEATARVSQ